MRWPTCWPGPSRCVDYLHHQLSWFELDDAVRRDGRADHLQPRHERLPENAARRAAAAAAGRSEWRRASATAPSNWRSPRKRSRVVQRLDPPGVGARTLKECLLLQLIPGMPYYDELRTLIANHLEDLENNRLPQISKKTGMSIEKIQEVWQELRKLKPKPGADFTETTVPSVTPDVFVERNDDGKYEVRLEDGQLPSLYISPYYRKLLRDEGTNAETREYIKRKINSAQWLIESIEQRRSTLTRVSQAIVDHQTKFLDDGPDHIEPLKMQQIADKVGVHVTTVSRAVDDKWIQTPRGIFPLKRFFVGGTTSGRRRGSRLGPRADQAARNHRQRRQDEAALRRCDRRRARQGRHHGRPPHGHQVPQGDEHPQLPRPPRLDEGREVARLADRRLHSASAPRI